MVWWLTGLILLIFDEFWVNGRGGWSRCVLFCEGLQHRATLSRGQLRYGTAVGGVAVIRNGWLHCHIQYSEDKCKYRSRQFVALTLFMFQLSPWNVGSNSPVKNTLRNVFLKRLAPPPPPNPFLLSHRPLINVDWCQVV